MLRGFVFSIVLLVHFLNHAEAGLVFFETFGTVGANTSFGAFSSATNGVGLTFSGTGDVRSTSSSAGYSTFVDGVLTSASGGANVFLASNGNSTLIIGNINTIGYDAGSLTLNFGGFKSTTASDLTHLEVAYSTDGLNFTLLSPTFQSQPTGTGTANWRALSVSPSNLVNSNSLSLRFQNTSGTAQVRLDDISLSGTITAVPEPSSFALLGVAIVTAGTGRRWRQKRMAG